VISGHALARCTFRVRGLFELPGLEGGFALFQPFLYLFSFEPGIARLADGVRMQHIEGGI
jgi:hypothetical protein